MVSPPARAGSSAVAAALPARSARKRQAILDAARSSFVAKGFDRSSMDEIAAAAAVSKPTVYKHLETKELLFVEAINAEIAAVASNTQAMPDALPTTRDLEPDLRTFARQHVVDLMQPDLLRMRRRLIAEAERFPELASAWYSSGPEEAQRALAAVLSALEARGLLRIDDARVAAEQLIGLLLIPVNCAMFVPRTTTRASWQRAADRAVDAFLAAYGARSSR